MVRNKLELPGGHEVTSALEEFERLGPGEHFVIRGDRPPSALNEALQARHPGRFEWWPLVEGPAEWQVLIVRCAGECKPKRPLLSLFNRDYVRVLVQLRATQGVLEEGFVREAVRRSGHLAARVRRHVQMCRDVVLPEALCRLGGVAGHLVRIEELHDAIAAALDRLNAAGGRFAEAATAGGVLSTPYLDTEPLSALLRVLRALVSTHAVQSERFLVPIIEHLCTEDERDAIVSRCRAFE